MLNSDKVFSSAVQGHHLAPGRSGGPACGGCGDQSHLAPPPVVSPNIPVRRGATPDFRAGLASVRKFWVDGDDQRIRQQWRWRLTAAPCHESRVSNVSPGMDGRSDRFRCHRAATRHFVVSHREHACLSSGASRPRVDFLVRNERNLRAPSELRRRTIITYQQLHNRVFGACGSRGQGICAPESLIDVV